MKKHILFSSGSLKMGGLERVLVEYLNKIDKVNSNKLKEHGVKGFSFQIQLSQETIDYLDSI